MLTVGVQKAEADKLSADNNRCNTIGEAVWPSESCGAL